MVDVQFSALIEPANVMLVADAADAWAAMAQFEAMIAEGSTVAALVRMTTDEFGDRRVTQVPLPLVDPARQRVSLERAELQRLQTRSARSGWMRGFSHAYWRYAEGFVDDRDYVPAAIAAELERLCPYPDESPEELSATELAAKDAR